MTVAIWRRTSLPLLIGLGFQLVVYLALVAIHLRHGTLTHGQIPVTARWYLIAFGSYLVTIWLAEARGEDGIGLILGGGLALRLVLLATIPSLSSDVYRYLWDGYVANQGVSPYQFPIDSPQLDYLDAPIRALANHTWMASPYLPAAQWLFSSVTGVLPLHPLSMQVVIVGIDLINAWLIVYLLGLAGLPARRVLIYFWNPLVVVEAAHGAHLDVWMAFLTLLAAALAYGRGGDRWRNRAGPWLAPVVLSLATLTKIVPALLAPVFFWRWNWRQRFLYALTLLLILLPAGMRAGWGLTGPLDGHGLFAALRIYGAQWNFNSGLFHWLEVGLQTYGGMEMAVANQLAKRTVGGLLLLTLLWTWWRARTAQQPVTALRLMSVPLIGYVLLTPTFHPWYLLLLLAFVPFLTPTEEEAQRRQQPILGWLTIAPWLYLSGALFLSYFTYRNPLDLREFEWVRRSEWMPTLLLLLTAVGARGVDKSALKALVRVNR